MGCCGQIKDFCVGQGATLVAVVRWGTDSLLTAAITGITNAAPAVVTAPGHGLPNGWPVAIDGVLGMNQINATRYPPQGSDYSPGTVLDANTVALDQISSAFFPPYVAGSGFIVYNTPVDLSDKTLTLSVWAAPAKTGTPDNTYTVGSGVTLDNVAKTIALEVQTDLLPALDWTTGYYNLDAVDGNGVVTRVLEGTITINT